MNRFIAVWTFFAMTTVGFLETSFSRNPSDFKMAVRPNGMNAEQIALLQAGVSAVLQILPNIYKEHLPDLEIQLNPLLKLADNHGKKSFIYGRAGGKLIDLHPDKTFETDENGLRLNRRFRRILVHEISHIFDDLDLHFDAEKSQLAHCRNEAQSNPPHEYKPFGACLAYKDTATSISTLPEFLDLAGWYMDSASGLRLRESFFNKRNLDSYELKNPHEFFAVNMEGFLLDPEYRCRRPGLARYLESKLQHKPFPANSCNPSHLYIDPEKMNDPKTAPGDALVQFDFNRLYQVHYLLAEKGSAMMSRWGHAMIRLVMCAPDRKTVGPECMADYEHHLVISFRAYVKNFQINTLDGLTGKYPSRLFILPMSQVVTEYTELELRNLFSFPLNMSRSQMYALTERALETHWSYDGKYYFLQNNCAVESLNLLKASLQDLNLAANYDVTPTGLLDSLQKLGLIDDSPMKDQRSAIRFGYLFPSLRPTYEKAIENLREVSPGIPDFESYIKLPAREREPMIQSVLQSVQPEQIRYTASLSLLEKRAKSLAIDQISSQIIDSYLKGELEKKDKEKIGALENAARFTAEFSLPSLFLSGLSGYGIPQTHETTSARANMNKYSKIGGFKESEKLQSPVVAEKDRQEVADINKNIFLIDSRLKFKKKSTASQLLP